MNAIGVWVLLPLAASVVLWFLRRRTDTVIFVALSLCLALAGLAWLLPIGKALHLGRLTLEVQASMDISGRQLVLNDTDRPLLIFFYAIGAFWFGGERQALGRHAQAPFGLGMIALLVAALAVEPQLYAALLIEIAVLLSIPMLVSPGEERIGQGVLRYLIFQTLATPFILLAGWALAAVEGNPSDTNLVLLASVFLGLGFAFWLAVFPFYSWVPMLAEDARPYVVGFLFLMLSSTALLLGVDFINAYGWLRTSEQLYLVLRLAGALMVVTAGIWAAFQHDAGRLMGYAIIMEVGFSLIALSLNSHLGTEFFAMLFLPRVIALGLWTLSASVLVNNGHSLQFASLERIAEQFPYAAAGMIIALLTLAGLPLLASFPARLALLQELAVSSPLTAIWVLAGSMGLLFSGFRLLAVVTGGYFGPRPRGENRTQIFLIASGIAALVLVGLAPRLFLPLLTRLLLAFSHLP